MAISSEAQEIIRRIDAMLQSRRFKFYWPKNVPISFNKRVYEEVIDHYLDRGWVIILAGVWSRYLKFVEKSVQQLKGEINAVLAVGGRKYKWPRDISTDSLAYSEIITYYTNRAWAVNFQRIGNVSYLVFMNEEALELKDQIDAMLEKGKREFQWPGIIPMESQTLAQVKGNYQAGGWSVTLESRDGANYLFFMSQEGKELRKQIDGIMDGINREFKWPNGLSKEGGIFNEIDHYYRLLGWILSWKDDSLVFVGARALELIVKIDQNLHEGRYEFSWPKDIPTDRGYTYPYLAAHYEFLGFKLSWDYNEVERQLYLKFDKSS
jgi:hypothetical protein